MKSAAIDIGNSRIKILSEEHGYAVYPITETVGDWFNELHQYIEKHTTPTSWVISSVNPNAEAVIIDMLMEYSSVITPSEYILDNQTLIDVRQVNGAGSDRIFGLIGATEYTKPPLITVDCGTAITVNYLDSDYVFQGGAILPGISTQLKALHHFTGQLPLLHPEYEDVAYGNTTVQAMTVGTIWGAIGAVREITSRIKASSGIPTIPIVFTGGEHPLIVSAFKDMEPILCPNLVVEGILVAHLSCESESNPDSE